MRRGLQAVYATMLVLLASHLVPAHPTHPASGLHVKDGRLVEANGQDLVLRGVNHTYSWYPNQTNGVLTAIKAAGANSARLTLTTGHRWPATPGADVSSAISLCRQHRLICILEAHDASGYGQLRGSATLDETVDYWISIRGALAGQENYVIINVANEPYGYRITKTWTHDTIRAIKRLRAAGFRHTLMVDAPEWSQDDTFTMRDNAPTVLAADPDRNTVFDIHMFGTFNTPQKVQSYLHSFVARRLPIVVAEFSHKHPHGKPAADAVMQYAQTYRVGLLGWLWSGDTEAAYLDMVNNFNPTLRTPWGVRFLTGVNGLRTNAREASIFASAPKRAKHRWNWSDLWPFSMAQATATRPVPARPPGTRRRRRAPEDPAPDGGRPGRGPRTPAGGRRRRGAARELGVHASVSQPSWT
jgi:mannan endo-1,4-beta-mannosidase